MNRGGFGGSRGVVGGSAGGHKGSSSKGCAGTLPMAGALMVSLVVSGMKLISKMLDLGACKGKGKHVESA